MSLRNCCVMYYLSMSICYIAMSTCFSHAYFGFNCWLVFILKPDPCYTAFHDEEWGLPVHDDRYVIAILFTSVYLQYCFILKPDLLFLIWWSVLTVICLLLLSACRKLFELLVLSGALAELTWPAILSKRHMFRYFAYPSSYMFQQPTCSSMNSDHPHHLSF
jgi:hypothetical protein